MSARAILEAHPLTRVILPLEDDQVQFVSPDNPALLAVSMATRIVTLSPGLVFGAPTQSWPEEVRRPEHWMMTDAQGLVPYLGAGTDQRDVRLWAWLAYLKHADLIQWSGALPEQNDPTAQADPGTPHLVLSRKLVRRGRAGAERSAQMAAPGAGGLRISVAGGTARDADERVFAGAAPDPAGGASAGAGTRSGIRAAERNGGPENMGRSASSFWPVRFWRDRRDRRRMIRW